MECQQLYGSWVDNGSIVAVHSWLLLLDRSPAYSGSCIHTGQARTPARLRSKRLVRRPQTRPHHAAKSSQCYAQL